MNGSGMIGASLVDAGVSAIYDTDSWANASERLKMGWTLLHVLGTPTGPCYVLGKIA